MILISGQSGDTAVSIYNDIGKINFEKSSKEIIR